MENWVDVPGYDGIYSVSDLGFVKSKANGVDRYLRFNMSRKYLKVALQRNGNRKDITVHRLVYESFNGPVPDGAYIRHLNDIRTDNRLCNLAVGSPQDNSDDRVANGKSPQGEKHHKARLTDKLVEDARRRYSAGEKVNVLARECGVTLSCMMAAISGKTWGHVPGAVELQGPARNRVISDTDAFNMMQIILDGGTAKQVAAQFGVSRATVYRRIKHAR